MNDLYVCTSEWPSRTGIMYVGEVWLFGLLCHVTDPRPSKRQAHRDAQEWARNN